METGEKAPARALTESDQLTLLLFLICAMLFVLNHLQEQAGKPEFKNRTEQVISSVIKTKK